MNKGNKKLLNVGMVSLLFGMQALQIGSGVARLVYADYVPDNTRGDECVTEATDDTSSGEDTGGSEDNDEELLKRKIAVYSAFKQYSATDEFIAGVMSAWTTESNIKAKRAEGDYLPAPVGASSDKSYDDPAWLSMGGTTIYNGKFPNILKRGLGLGQFTDTSDGGRRHTLLLEFAEKQGKKWYDLDLQLVFTLTADSGAGTFVSLAQKSYSDPKLASDEFTAKWEGVTTGEEISKHRQKADSILAEIKSGKIKEDAKKASSIKSMVEKAGGVASGSGNPSDGGSSDSNGSNNSGTDASSLCPPTSGSNETASDGTGDSAPLMKYADGVKGDSVPVEMKQYIAYDPKVYGLSWGSTKGWEGHWYEGQAPAGQCTEFSASMMYALYNKSMHSGNGADVARNWAGAYGGSVTKTPKAGMVASVPAGAEGTGSAGHTYIVQHVFQNGDVLISEQNFVGLSGESNGTPYTWDYRIIKKATYTASGCTYWKPEGQTPNKPNA